MQRSTFLPVLVLGLITACSSGAADTPRVERSDSAGVQIVRNLSPDRPLDWRLERVLALGGAEEGPESFFNLAPPLVDTDAAGNLYVLDQASHRVLAFAPDGSHLRTMGQRGGGPGELEMGWMIGVEGDGTVNVFDISKQSLVRWDPRGEILPPAPVQGSINGRFAFLGNELVASVPSSSGLEGVARNRLVRVASGDTVEYAVLDQPLPGFVDFGCVGLNIPSLFSPALVWDAMDAHIAYTTGVDYALTVHDGGTVRSVRRDMAPRAVTKELAIAEVGEEQTVTFGGGHAPCKIPGATMVEGRGFASELPSINGISVAPDGEIWVRRGFFKDEPEVIDAFAADGVYLGTLPAETPFPVAWTPGGEMIAIEKDEMDLTYLVVYRVVRS